MNIKMVLAVAPIVFSLMVCNVTVDAAQKVQTVKTSSTLQKGSVVQKSYEDTLKELQAQTDASKISFRVNSGPATQSNGDVDWMIENKAVNKNLFKVEYTTKDGKVVYTSPILKPGTNVTTAPMLVKLSKGEYSLLATITVYEPTKQAQLGKTCVNVKLIVK